jgi:hypothetical protein
MENEPKWFLMTKRGVGMAIAAALVVLPFANQYFGLHLDVTVVKALGDSLSSWLDVSLKVFSAVLMVWGMFRPTGPLTVLPPKKDEPVAPVVN